MKTPANRLVRLIALFKLLKAILLIAVGVGALKMIHIDLARVLAEWAARLGFDPGSRYVGQALLKAAALTPNKIEALAVGLHRVGDLERLGRQRRGRCGSEMHAQQIVRLR